MKNVITFLSMAVVMLAAGARAVDENPASLSTIVFYVG
jgi:hypothetical protein